MSARHGPALDRRQPHSRCWRTARSSSRACSRPSRSAQREVLLETFILFEDKVGLQLHAALLAAARRGVQVDVTVDGCGSPDLSDEFIGALTDAGVRMHVFDPRHAPVRLRASTCSAACTARSWWSTASVAFVGGINYSADHLADFGPEAKQDYAVEIDGPLVAEIHRFATRRWRTASATSAAQLVAAPHAAPRTQPTAGRARARPQAMFVTRDNRRPPHRHRAPLPRRDPRGAAARDHRQRLLLPRLPAAARNCAARRGAACDVRLILQGEPDMPIVKTAAEHALPPPAARRRAHLRILRAAAARQGRGDRRRVGHRRLEQPRPAEPVAQPRGQRHHPRPRLQPASCASAWST